MYFSDIKIGMKVKIPSTKHGKAYDTKDSEIEEKRYDKDYLVIESCKHDSNIGLKFDWDESKSGTLMRNSFSDIDLEPYEETNYEIF